MLGQETHLAALFILDDKIFVDVGTFSRTDEQQC